MLEHWQEETKGPEFLERHLAQRFANITYDGASLPGAIHKTRVPEYTALVIAEYLSRWRDYAAPQSDRGWEWFVIDHEAIRRDFPNAAWRASEKLHRIVEAREREHEAERYPTVAAWLHAFHRGKLRSVGPQEKHTACVLGPRGARGSYGRYRAARVRADRARVRLCSDCGAEFAGAHRKVVRCPDCRPKKSTRTAASKSTRSHPKGAT